MLKKLQDTLKNQKAKLKNQKGFTLIELIVVIAILGVLAMLIMPSVMSFQSNADEAVAKQQFKILNQSYLAKKALGTYDTTDGATLHAGITAINTVAVPPAGTTAEAAATAQTAAVTKLTNSFGDSVNTLKVRNITINPLDATHRNSGLKTAVIIVKNVPYICTAQPDGTVDSKKE